MRSLKTEIFVKSLRVGAVVVRRKLNHPAVFLARPFNRPFKHFFADSLPAHACGDANRFDLGAFSGCKTARGCGSKVIAVGTALIVFARLTTVAIIR